MDYDGEIYDVLIVGAGPCGLAVAARLAETTPSALFTDSEHQRYHWMKKHNLQTRKAQRVSRRANTACDRLVTGKCHAHTPRLKLAVLDAASAQWMGSWDRKFDDLSISHLRSPMFFHPDPRDRDGLLGYAYLEKREKELVEIKGVVGKGLSKHQRKLKSKKNSGKQEVSYLDERDRNDYFRPSASLFKHYCGDIVSRYQLHNVVQKAEVESVAYDESKSLFTVHTSAGVKRSQIVVFAVGAALKPALPCDCTLDAAGSVTHAFKQDKVGLPRHVLAKIERGAPTNVVVVGGGLTSAQIVDMAVRAGVTKVWHLMRGPLKGAAFFCSLLLISLGYPVLGARLRFACDGSLVSY
ncbi:FAD binding domain-containing protein [Phlyctema vagabunda]|uniref:L-ornithine N(5)-monooxygenase [NAD(P)H] n=1 Tax=Phlyctema vagabunda TaxID=108571 RepID=A0ABR4PRE7_9HELO